MDSQNRNTNTNNPKQTSNDNQQSVRPKTWNRNQRKFGKNNGAKGVSQGRINKSRRKSWMGFDASRLSKVPENSILESFLDQRDQKLKEQIDWQKLKEQIDWPKEKIVEPTDEFIPFPTIESSEFNHTYPKPIGWGRKKDNLGNTVNLDTRDSLEFENYNQFDSCFGILHSKMDPVKRPECAFCKRNNSKDYFHLLKDELGGVVCPVLSAFTCKMCAATGRNAHTHKYCPVNPITKGDPVAAGMPPGRPLTKTDKEWLKYFHTKFLLQLLSSSDTIAR